MRDDDPEDTLGDVFLSAMFGAHPVGRPVIGSVGFGLGDDAGATAFVPRPPLHPRADGGRGRGQRRPRRGGRAGARALRPPAGSRPQARAAPQGHGPGARAGRPCSWSTGTPSRPTCRSGVRTPGRHWEHRWALSVLNTALGGGLSSRLFQQIRETRGLAYSVYSTVDTFSDSGALSVYAACLPERFDEVARVTTDVLEAVARDGITEAECRIAKGSLRGGLVLGLEDSGSRMNRIGRSELNYGEHRSIDRDPRADRRGHSRRGQRRRAQAADQAVRCGGAGPVPNQKVTAAAASGHRRLIAYRGSGELTVPTEHAASAGWLWPASPLCPETRPGRPRRTRPAGPRPHRGAAAKATTPRSACTRSACPRAGPPRTRRATATTAAPTTSGSPRPRRSAAAAAVMTRRRRKPKAANNRPLIGELATKFCHGCWDDS